MGVINITPNSFSDPKKFLNSITLKETLNLYKNKTNIIFDFGFESTAPKNSAIGAEEERARFDTFFELIKEIDLTGCWISFDTYRPRNFLYFEEKFKSRYHDLGFVFNDVSGVIDYELVSFLKTKIIDKNFYYLYSFTHIPSRDKVLNHMEFIREGDIVSMCADKLKDAYAQFREIGIAEKIIMDPCFGFSKTYEQNWELVNRLDEVVNQLDFKVPWLVGVSKKTFLRAALSQSLDPYTDSENLHADIIKDMLVKKMGHLIFRVHDFEIVGRVYAGL